MRTIALLAMTGIIAAAEKPTPAPAPFPPARLNTAEITALNAVDTRMRAIREEFEGLSKQLAAIKSDACQRALSVANCDIKADGSIVKIEPPKEPAK